MSDITSATPMHTPDLTPRLDEATRDRARRYVAGRALDTDDALELLGMLGLLPTGPSA